MMRRLIGQLPNWARAEHPVLRYELGRSARPPLRVRLLRAFLVVVIGLVLLGGSYLIATDLLRQPLPTGLTAPLNEILFWPLLAVQVIMGAMALTLTANVVGDEIRRQTWDNLRATESGAELTLRARWALVFYRVRGLLALIIVLRVVLIVGILYDLTAFEGRYLSLLITGIEPTIPEWLGVLMVSFLMTSALLLPLTAVGFDASLGLWISAVIQQRTYSTLVQGLFILIRIGITAGLLWFTTQWLVVGSLPATDVGSWALLFGYGAIGDWGLAFLNLQRYSDIWTLVPYGIFLGAALLLFALVQAAVADQVLVLAVRRAQRRG
ncbi:MAG: hypothetical protein GYB67_11195 [Chloroflexi bacterium]|nr:hypothetical protein [Chloroflexota bacterium]